MMTPPKTVRYKLTLTRSPVTREGWETALCRFSLTTDVGGESYLVAEAAAYNTAEMAQTLSSIVEEEAMRLFSEQVELPPEEP
jgi:hypothetical protein